MAESDFRNNVAKCKVHDYGNFVICDKCWIGKIISATSKILFEHLSKCCNLICGVIVYEMATFVSIL